MKIFNNIICILSSTAVVLTAVLSLCPEKVIADEPQEPYNIVLSIDTVEIDINDIPENREVELGVYIENNPGFMGLCFVLQRDDRFVYKEHLMFDLANNILGLTFHEFLNNKNVVDIALSPGNCLYYDNGKIMTVRVFLPENISVGDLYSVNFLDYYEDEQTKQSPAIARENSFDAYKGIENFKEFRNGGVRITGQIPVETPAPKPEIIVTQPPQVSQPNEQNPQTESTVKNEETTVSEKTEISETTTKFPETTLTSVSAEKITVSDTQPTTLITTVTETSEKIIEITSAIPETEPSGTIPVEDKPDKKSPVLPIAAAVGVLACAGIISIILIKGKEKNNENK